jgi:hypothetical protein
MSVKRLFIDVKASYTAAPSVTYTAVIQDQTFPFASHTVSGTGTMVQRGDFWIADIPWTKVGQWSITLADGSVLSLPKQQTFSCCFNYISGIDTLNGVLTIRGGMCSEGIAQQMVRDYQGWTYATARNWVITHFPEPLRVGTTANWPPK